MYIGITLRYEEFKDREVFLLSKKFKDIFDSLNVTLIPIMSTTNLDGIVKICDGLILTGSPIHVNPELYHEEKDKNVDYNFSYQKEDELDYLLIKKFTELHKPILGICRGIQVLNVYFGGTLKQRVLNHEGVNHKVKIYPNSFLHDLYGNHALVCSTHTQAIDKVANDFDVIAVSNDNIIEGIKKDNIIGIQWHPEKLMDKKFFESFINLYCLK